MAVLRKMKDGWLFALTFGIVLLSRLPFIHAGYGIDPDAWRVLQSAQFIASTHEYTVSRLPGYPVQEILYSIFSDKGPVYFNGMTAFFSAAGIGLFVLALRKIGSSDSLLTGIALACTPIVFINSVNSMDYVWALSFVLGSMYCIIVRRPVVAGVLLGLAVGCRITSGAMAVPLGMMLAVNNSEKKALIKEIVQFLAGTIAVSATVFSPVYMKYGFGFFTFSDGDTPMTAILRAATIEVWGVIGLLAIVAAIAVAIARRKRIQQETAISPTTPWGWIMSWTVGVGLYATAFLRLPGDAGYLIPVLPFLFLLLGRYSSRRNFVVVCIAVVSSSFLVGIDSTDRPWSVSPSKFSVTISAGGRKLAVDLLQGPIINDRLRRLRRMEFVDRVVSFAESQQNRCVIVAGVWLPQIVMTLGGKLPDNRDSSYSLTSGRATYVGLLDEGAVEQYLYQGRRVYYIQGQEEYNRETLGVNIVELGAQEIFFH